MSPSPHKLFTTSNPHSIHGNNIAPACEPFEIGMGDKVQSNLTLPIPHPGYGYGYDDTAHYYAIHAGLKDDVYPHSMYYSMLEDAGMSVMSSPRKESDLDSNSNSNAWESNSATVSLTTRKTRKKATAAKEENLDSKRKRFLERNRLAGKFKRLFFVKNILTF
jgi:hypothetical protein